MTAAIATSILSLPAAIASAAAFGACDGIAIFIAIAIAALGQIRHRK